MVLTRAVCVPCLLLFLTKPLEFSLGVRLRSQCTLDHNGYMFSKAEEGIVATFLIKSKLI